VVNGGMYSRHEIVERYVQCIVHIRRLGAVSVRTNPGLFISKHVDSCISLYAYCQGRYFVHVSLHAAEHVKYHVQHQVLLPFWSRGYIGCSSVFCWLRQLIISFLLARCTAMCCILASAASRVYAGG